MDKGERLQEFFRRLTAAPAAQDLDSAFSLLSSTLNAVEDDFSGVSYNPEAWATDGRMYPPQSDNFRPVDGCPSVTRIRSRSHNTYIGSNGAIEIQQPDRQHQGRVYFCKEGADGKGVWSN